MQKNETLRLKDLLQALEEWAPVARQESYDNAGLILGRRDPEISRALICFDITPQVVDEAVEKNAQLIISHHPAIFKGLKKIDPDSRIGYMLSRSLQHDLAWYAMHTNLDNTPSGVNSYLSKKLALTRTCALVPTGTDEERQVGAGVIGSLSVPLSEKALLDTLKELTGVRYIRHSGFTGRQIRTLALCGGSGGSFIEAARAQKADVYITGDLRYHDFTDIEPDTWLVDIGHFESEQFVKELIYEYITEKFPNFAAHISERSVNPVSFY